jgi:hypothetical protein
MRTTRVLTAALVCGAILLSPIGFWACAGDDNITYETYTQVECVPGVDNVHVFLRVDDHAGRGARAQLYVELGDTAVVRNVFWDGESFEGDWEVDCK